MVILGVALAATIGLVLGLLGGGGSILTVPIFVYVLGFDAKTAIAISLAVVGVTSLFGMLAHWRAGNVNAKIALTFGGVATAGTYLGARLAVLFTGTTQLLLFAIVMLTAAIFMFREESPLSYAASGSAARQLRGWLVALEGITVGVFTGLVGVGGGFLVVPALATLGRLPMREAVGTSLAVIAMKSFAGLAGYAGQVDVPWAFVVSFTAIALLGALVGTSLTRVVPPGALRRAFAVFLLMVGVVILFENRRVFMPSTTATAQELAPVATGEQR